MNDSQPRSPLVSSVFACAVLFVSSAGVLMDQGPNTRWANWLSDLLLALGLAAWVVFLFFEWRRMRG